jgi:hypothetical protein
MEKVWPRILALVSQGNVRISEHGYDELSQDGLLAREIVAGVGNGLVVEEYPDYPKGPCVLVLQRDAAGNPVHVVWGIPRNAASPAVLVTAYRPDAALWSEDWIRRRTK